MARRGMAARYGLDLKSRGCSLAQLQKSLENLAIKDARGVDCSQEYRLLLHQCGDALAISQGRQAHCQIKSRGYDAHDTRLCNTLILMYNRCGSLREARQVFDDMKSRDVFTWNFMISAYAKNGHDSEALRLYRQMDTPANSFIYASALAACASLGALEQGREIHRSLSKFKACRDDVVVQNALVTMYSKCGRLDEGRKLFDEMATRSLVSWNAMISACVQADRPKEALELYRRLKRDRLNPNRFICASILTACADLRDLETGQSVHRHLLDAGLKLDNVVENALVNMYGKCGKLNDAEKVLYQMKNRDVCVWNTIITAYGLHGHSAQVFESYRRMNREMLKPDEGTFCGLIAACRNLEEGNQVHHEVIACGQNDSVVVGTALMVMYSRCGSLEDTKCMFDNLRSKDAAAWAVMITAYEQHGEPEKAIQLFKQMTESGSALPTASAYASAIQACSAAEDFEQGKCWHKDAAKDRLDDEASVQRVLVNMYCKFGDLAAASEIFEQMQSRDVVTWTAMIGGYVRLSKGKEALKLYERMKSEGVEPDYVTYAEVIGACSMVGDLKQGKVMHSRVPQDDCASPLVAGALVTMYARCGCVESAQRVFDELQYKDILAWNALIAGYTHLGYREEALGFYHRMNLEGVEPTHQTFLSVLALCQPALSRGFETGRALSARIVSSGYDSDPVKAALVSMYCRCGGLEEAVSTLEGMQRKDVHFWNMVMSSYNKKGAHDEVLAMYKRMDATPDSFTFYLALTACSSLGLSDEGKEVHKRILHSGFENDFLGNVLITMYAKLRSLKEAKQVFDEIKDRTVVTWTAMIAAYTQAGSPREALDLYKEMDIEPDDVTYACLLNACTELKALDIGTEVYARCLASNKVSMYVTSSLQNLYAKCGLTADARKVFDGTNTDDIVLWNSMITSYAHHAQVNEVLDLYKLMELEGVPPDRVTLLSVLASCSHGGKIEEAKSYFASIVADHELELNSGHYRWIVDMLSRAGDLADAEELIQSLPWSKDVVPWKPLLASCRHFGDTDRGSRAAQHLGELEPKDSAPYLIMPYIYAAAGT